MTTNNPGYDGPTPEHYFKAIEAQRDALQARLDGIAEIMTPIANDHYVQNGNQQNQFFGISLRNIRKVHALATGQEVEG